MESMNNMTADEAMTYLKAQPLDKAKITRDGWEEDTYVSRFWKQKIYGNRVEYFISMEPGNLVIGFPQGDKLEKGWKKFGS